MANTPKISAVESDPVVPPTPKITADTLQQKLYEQITAEPKKPSTLERVINALGRAYGIPWDSPEERIRKEQVKRDQQASRLGTLLTITSAAEKSQEEQRRYEAQVKQAAEARKYAMGRDEKMDQRYEEKRKAEEQTRVANSYREVLGTWVNNSALPITPEVLQSVGVEPSAIPTLSTAIAGGRDAKLALERKVVSQNIQNAIINKMTPEQLAVLQVERERIAKSSPNPVARQVANLGIAAQRTAEDYNSRPEAGELKKILSSVESIAEGVVPQAMEASGINFDMVQANGASINQALTEGNSETFVSQIANALQQQGVNPEVIGQVVSTLQQNIQALAAPSKEEEVFTQVINGLQRAERSEVERQAAAIGIEPETMAQVFKIGGVPSPAERISGLVDLSAVGNVGAKGFVPQTTLQNMTQMADPQVLKAAQNRIYQNQQARQIKQGASNWFASASSRIDAAAQANLPLDTADMSDAELMLYALQMAPAGVSSRDVRYELTQQRQSDADHRKNLEGLRDVLLGTVGQLEGKLDPLTEEESATLSSAKSKLTKVNRELENFLTQRAGMDFSEISAVQPPPSAQEVKPLNADQKRAVDVMIGGAALPPAQALADFLGVDIHTAAATKLGLLPNGRAITVVDLYQAEIARGRTQEEAQKAVAAALNKALPEMAKRAIDNTLYEIRGNWSNAEVKESISNRASVALKQLSPKGLRQLVQDLEAIAQNKASFVLDEGQISNLIYDTISKNLQQDAERMAFEDAGFVQKGMRVMDRVVETLRSGPEEITRGRELLTPELIGGGVTETEAKTPERTLPQRTTFLQDVQELTRGAAKEMLRPLVGAGMDALLSAGSASTVSPEVEVMPPVAPSARAVAPAVAPAAEVTRAPEPSGSFIDSAMRYLEGMNFTRDAQVKRDTEIALAKDTEEARSKLSPYVVDSSDELAKFKPKDRSSELERYRTPDSAPAVEKAMSWISSLNIGREQKAKVAQVESMGITPTIDIIIETELPGHKALRQIKEDIAARPSLTDAEILTLINRQSKIKDRKQIDTLSKELINYRDQLRKK